MSRPGGASTGPSAGPTNRDAGARREPSPHQLRLFAMLAEELHFGRAAARLFMTQPAFSQQIRALEQRLGVPLVERSSRAVELTAAGRALLPEARTVVDAMARVRQVADIHAREVVGHLSVGSIGAEAAMLYARAVLGRLRERHPGLTVEMRTLNFLDHIDALNRDEVDVVFLRPPVPPGIQTLHLATEPRVAVLSAADPLAARSRITLAQLAGYPVADVPPGVSRIWWDFWAVDPRPDGSPVRYGPVVADVEALLHAVSTGQAMCFLPAAARDLFPRPGVAYLEVADLSPSTSALAWAAKNRDRPTVTAARHAAEQVVAAGWKP